MQVAVKIHSSTDLATLPERLFSSVLSLMPGALMTLGELDLKTGAVTEKISVGHFFES